MRLWWGQLPEEDVFFSLVNLTLRSCCTRTPPNPRPPATHTSRRAATFRADDLLSSSWRFGSFCSYKREDTCPLMMLAAVEKEADSSAPSSVRHRKVWCRASWRRCAALGRAPKRIKSYSEWSCRSVTGFFFFHLTCVREGCCICELRGGKRAGYTTVQAALLPGTAFRAGLQALVCRGRRHFSLKKRKKENA